MWCPLLVLCTLCGCLQKAEEQVGPAPRKAAKTEAYAGMVHLEGGAFKMGSREGLRDEEPVHEVTVGPFWIDKSEVTNAQFSQFVKETGYVTIAEQKPSKDDFPGVPEDKLVPGSLVMTGGGWDYVAGADWRHPLGPGSDLVGKDDHPVVHVAWDDAMAYAKWAGKDLPTEAEWEFAARGGKDQLPLVWGTVKEPGGKHMANVWDGMFPDKDNGLDGFTGTAPSGSFPANGYGLVDIAGNVWEWCKDWYRPDYYSESPPDNPPGPDTSYDPDEPMTPKRVMRGGSFLCSDNYCRGYRPSARMKSSPDTGLFHTGFRCVVRG